MMNQQELEPFKEILESSLVTDIFNHVKKEERLPLLSNMITFLTVTKQYNRLEEYLERKNSSISQYFFDQNSFHKAYFENGYLYHITGNKNVESILESGILTLNKKYNQNMFIDCKKVNRCWNTIMKRNEKPVKSLIVIPNYGYLYKKRFNSVYLTTNLSWCWKYYGKGSELFYRYVTKLGKILGVETNQPKEELQTIITDSLKEQYDISEKEVHILIEFYNKYYDSTYLNKKVEDKAVIMVPFENAKRKNKTSFYNYKHIVKDSTSFEKYFFKISDIEHKGSIDKEGLVAITIDSFDENKAKLKVRTNKLLR